MNTNQFTFRKDLAALWGGLLALALLIGGSLWVKRRLRPINSLALGKTD